MNIWRNGDTLDLVHFAPAHTDTDIYIHFHKADVLHLGDIWFNGIYPFIDEGTGGSIGGMIRAAEKALAVAGGATKMIPGHGPLGTKAEFQRYRDMLVAVRDKVAALKSAGASEQEAVAKKPTAEFDAAWGKGFMTADSSAGLCTGAVRFLTPSIRIVREWHPAFTEDCELTTASRRPNRDPLCRADGAAD